MDERKYYGQQCQDDEINKAFGTLHRNIVDEIIRFCQTYDIVIDEVSLRADGIRSSIPYGEWQPCTDSSLVFSNDNKKEPFLYSM